MKKIILALSLALIFFPILWEGTVFGTDAGSASFSGKSFNEPLKTVCNKVMIAIYDAILSMRDKDDQLVDFGQPSLSKNPYGIYAIEYHHKIAEGIREGEFLDFGVTIVRPEDTAFNEYGQWAFNFGFPLLNLKFAGFQKTNRKWMRFNIQTIVQKNGDPLLVEQQKYLPLKLTLVTDKENYKVRDNIEFTVFLENISHKNLWVRDLDKDTLYFLYNGTKWGAVEVGGERAKRERKYILRPGEKESKKFVGSGSAVPAEIEIYCSYAMTFEGVKPFAIRHIKVTK